MTTPQTTQGGGAARRLTTETKSFFKTSEFWVYVVTVLAVLIAGNSIEGEEGGVDVLAADKVWLYVTLLTIAYLVSRGVAKAGVRDPYWDRPDTGGTDAGGAPLTERVKAAAHVLTDPDAAAQATQGQQQPPPTPPAAPPPSGPPVA